MKPLIGPLIVDGWTVPMARVVEGDENTTVGILLDGRMCWMIEIENFDHIAKLVAASIAIGLGLPCAPQEGMEDNESFMRQIASLHIGLRPCRAMQIGGKPELKVVK